MMTRQELENIWGRYMHRMDLGSDYSAVYDMTAQMISERLLSIPTPDIDDILANAPRMLVHGGLLYLHELAQDDDGMSRENNRFDVAVQDYAVRYSIDNVQAIMNVPISTNGV